MNNKNEIPVNWKSGFARLMVSQAVSMLGSSVVSLAILWYITLLTGSGLTVAAVTATNYLPQLLVLLPGGILADRYSSKKIIILSDSFIAVSTVILAVFFFAGLDSIGWILFFNFLRSLGAGIQMPAIRSILPQLVPEEYLMKGNSINTGIWSVISLISPGVGGLILNCFAMQYVLLLDVVTFLIGTSIFLTVRFNYAQVCDVADASSNTWFELKNGFYYLKNNKKLKNSMVFYAVFQFLIIPASQLSPLLATINLGEDVWILTFIETAFSLGALVISLVMACRTFSVKHFTLIGISSMLFGATMIGVLCAHTIVVFLAFMLLMGIGSPLYYTPLITYIQENTDEIYMGRVFSYMDFFGTMAIPLGMLLFGPLADIGIWISFLLPGIGLIILGLVGIFQSRRLKL